MVTFFIALLISGGILAFVLLALLVVTSIGVATNR